MQCLNRGHHAFCSTIILPFPAHGPGLSTGIQQKRSSWRSSTHKLRYTPAEIETCVSYTAAKEAPLQMHRFVEHVCEMSAASKVRVYSESVEIEAMPWTLVGCMFVAKPAKLACRSSLASLSVHSQLESFLYCFSPARQGTLVDGRQHRPRNGASTKCFWWVPGRTP